MSTKTAAFDLIVTEFVAELVPQAAAPLPSGSMRCCGCRMPRAGT